MNYSRSSTQELSKGNPRWIKFSFTKLLLLMSLRNKIPSLGIKELNKIRRNFLKNSTTIYEEGERKQRSVLSFRVLHKISYLCKCSSNSEGKKISLNSPPHTAPLKCYYNNCKLKHLKTRRLKLSEKVLSLPQVTHPSP